MTKRPLCMGVSGLDAPYVCGRPGRISTDQRKSCSGKCGSWIREHPKVTICGEVTQTTENEFHNLFILAIHI